jgi:hypothetical protein
MMQRAPPRTLYYAPGDRRVSDVKLYCVEDAAQPGIAADRFAREIVCILTAYFGALAATECQPVRRLLFTAILDFKVARVSTCKAVPIGMTRPVLLFARHMLHRICGAPITS